MISLGTPDREPVDYEAEDARMDNKLRAAAYAGEAEPEVVACFATELTGAFWNRYQQGEHPTDLIEELQRSGTPVDLEAARLLQERVDGEE